MNLCTMCKEEVVAPVIFKMTGAVDVVFCMRCAGEILNTLRATPERPARQMRLTEAGKIMDQVASDQQVQLQSKAGPFWCTNVEASQLLELRERQPERYEAIARKKVKRAN